jgi:riboflavin kinase
MLWIQCLTTIIVIVDVSGWNKQVAAWMMMPVTGRSSHHHRRSQPCSFTATTTTRLVGLPFQRTFVLSSEQNDDNDDDDDDGESTTRTTATRAKELPQILRFRGIVDQGYGRGGKKLGVPTANLPASLFQNALEEVSTGVYFGWTALERDDDLPKKVYKSVVNVGYSPTFEGKENPEKIIEAHLILDDGGDDDGSTESSLPDFYGVPMRLQLIGFLRDEQKFDSFPDLIAQINADIEDAKNSLDEAPYRQYQTDGFFATSSSWVGSSGGDETASWDFAPRE